MSASGASNRQRHLLSERARSAEAQQETLRLCNLPAAEAEQLREIFDMIEWGVFAQPEAPCDEPVKGKRGGAKGDKPQRVKAPRRNRAPVDR